MFIRDAEEWKSSELWVLMTHVPTSSLFQGNGIHIILSFSAMPIVRRIWSFLPPKCLNNGLTFSSDTSSLNDLRFFKYFHLYYLDLSTTILEFPFAKIFHDLSGNSNTHCLQLLHDMTSILLFVFMFLASKPKMTIRPRLFVSPISRKCKITIYDSTHKKYFAKKIQFHTEENYAQNLKDNNLLHNKQ